MKTRKTIFGIMALCGMDAAVYKPNGVFAKQKLQRIILTWMSILFVIGFIACDNGDEETHTHTWGAWQETKAPTVTAEGEETRTCAACGEKETQPIAKLPACTCPEGTTHLAGEKCCEGTDCNCQIAIKRTFTITGFAKPITVKDMRTGADDTDLETLGIISRLEATLSVQTNVSFNRALQFGMVIEVEETTEYARFKARSGNRMGANIDYVLSDNPETVNRMNTAFVGMGEMTPDEE